MNLKCDAVFEGGGVKGIAFAGAICELERAGYSFENIVGTSAGAIAAALLASGYTGREIEKELIEFQLNSLNKKGRFGTVGSIFNFMKDYGVYNSKSLLVWIENLLKKKGKRTFKDIKTESKNEKYKYKCQMIASDITDQRMLVLPRDLASFGIDPDECSIAFAVQMSMSIPFYYEPVHLIDKNGCEHLIADGGLLSNYPLWVLDADNSEKETQIPTFGLKFQDKEDCELCGCGKIKSIVEYSQSVFTTMIDGHDNYYISKSNGDFERTIFISPVIIDDGEKLLIKTTDFDISEKHKKQLITNGRTAARDFLQTWAYSQWLRRYR